MAKQETAPKKVEGTDVIENPTPDSEKPTADADTFDFDFNYLNPSGSQNEPPPSEEAPPEDGGQAPGKEGAPPKKKEEPPPSTPDIEAITHDSEIGNLRNEIAARDQKIKELEPVATALKEIEKEPLAFVKRYFPQLATQISQDKYILERAKKELNITDPNFKYDSTEAYIEGTQSYQFRLKEAEIRDNLSREMGRIEAERIVQQKQREALLSSSKAKVMKQYKLDENGYKQLETWASGYVVTPEDWAKLRYFDLIVKSAVERAVKGKQKLAPGQEGRTPSVTEISGDEGEHEDAANKEFEDTFGEKL